MAGNAATDVGLEEKDDFTDGFAEGSSLRSESKPQPEAKTEPEIEAHPKAEPEAEPKPEYVQLTKEQFESLQAAATKTTAIEAQLSKAFGSVGDLQQIVRKLQSTTPAGQPIDLPKGALAKTRKDFPELAELIESDLTEALKGLRGTATTTAPVEVDHRALQDLVTATTVKYEIEALEDAHPTWRDIVGAVDSEGRHDPSNPFRQWLAKQDQTYQAKINSTNSSAVISRAIDKFLASKAAPAVQPKPAPKVAARVNRIRSAVQPKGDGGLPSSPKPTDDFAQGFEEEYRARVG